MHPLLSIYIPTYNRAHLLESALLALISQLRKVGGDVELVISDDCSSDNTAEMVHRLQQLWPIRYHRNDENMGAVRNVLQSVDLVAGEFTWIHGDDDLMRPGGIEHVLSVLKAHPEIDYVFVNYSLKEMAEREAYGRIVSGSDFPNPFPASSKSLSDRYVENWEELIDPDVNGFFMGAFICSVFRTSRWKSYSLNIKGVAEYTSLETTYPHVVILAHTMRGTKAYYIGYPYIIAFGGYQPYKDYLPMIYTVRLQEIVDLHEHLGLDPERVKKCRRSLLHTSLRGLRKIALDRSTLGRECFSLRDFLWRYRRDPLALSMCLFVIIFPYSVYGVAVKVYRWARSRLTRNRS